jgi:carboxymethylenebutenolidase
MTMGIQRLIWQIERRVDAFHEAIYRAGDLDAALAVVTEDGELVNLPTGTGGRGPDDLRRYFAEDLLPHLPADLTFRRVSRTVDQRRLVEESMVGFTHDRELPWLLPGAEPTLRPVEVHAISIVSIQHTTRLGSTESRIASHRTLWDLSGLAS